MEYSMQSGDSYWQDGQLAESGADGSCGDATETAEYNSAEQHVVDSEKQFAMNDSEPTQLIGDPFDVANTDTNESDQVGDEQKRKSNGYSNSQYPFLTESLVYENTCSPTGDDHDQDHDHDQEAPEETQTPTEDSRDVPCEPDPKSDECEQMEVEETETGATEVEVETESEEAEKVQGEDDAVGSEEQAVEEIDGQDVESNASTERMADGDDQRSCSSVVIRDADADADASEPVAAVAHANAEAESLENQADTSNEPEGEGEGEGKADSHTCFESESSEQMLSAFQAENRYVPHSEPLSVDDDEQGQSADSPLQSARNETSSLATQQEALVVDTKMIESAYHEDDDALVITDPLSAEQNGKPVSPPFSPSVEPANVTPQDSCLSPEAAAPSNQVDVADEESLSDTKHHDEHVAQETTRQSVCDAAAPKHCDDELGEHEHHEVLSAKHQDEEHVDQELHDVFTESSTTHQSVCMSPSDAAALKHQEVQNAAQQLHERDVMSQSDAAAVNQPEVEASVCGEQKAFEEIPQNLQSVQREAELRPDGDDSTAHLVPELMHFSPEHHNQATSMTEAATALEEKSGDACTTLESIPGNEQFANSNSHAETPSDVVKTSTPTAARDLESQHLDAGEQNLPDYALNGADNFKFVEQIEPQNVAQPTLEQVSEFSVESSVENRQNMQRSAHSADSQPCIEEVVVNFVDSNTERSTESRQITSGAEEQASRTEPVKIEEQPQPQQMQAQVNEQPAESQDANTGEHDARNEQITKWLEHTEAATQGGVDKDANKNSAVEANPNCTTKADEQTTEAQPIPLGGIESEQREQPAEPAPAATEKPGAPKTLPAKPRQIPTATNGTKKPEKAAPAPAATKSTAAPASAAAAKKPVEKPAQTPTGKAPPAPAAKAAPSKPTAAPSKTAGTSVAATKAVATPTKELPGPPLAKAAASASAKPAESAAKGAAKDAKAPAAAASKVPPPAASTGAATATAADKKAPAAAAAASQKRASLSLPQKTPLTSAKPAAAAPKAAPAKPSAPGPKAASSKISASNASLHKAK